MLKDLQPIVKGTIAGILVIIGISIVSAGTYIEPGQDPTGGNPDAPLNVGATTQTKTGGNIVIQGGLSTNTFTSYQNAYFAQKVGVGTQNPQYSLQVGDKNVTGSDGSIGIGKNGGGYRNMALKYDSNFDFGFYDEGSNKQFAVNWQAPANSLYVNGSGNVGINNAAPASKLDVGGTIKGDYFVVDPQDAVNEGGEIQLKGAGSYAAFQIDNNSGNARIHTLGSGKFFQVIGSGSGVAAEKYCDVNGANCISPTESYTYQYGGSYQLWWAGGCRKKNALTGSCSCPAGFKSSNTDEFYDGAGDYYCKPGTNVCGKKDYICARVVLE